MGLDMNQCIRLGYDGCATMAEHISGVPKEKNPKAHFFYCASHRLNLVINNLNSMTKFKI